MASRKSNTWALMKSSWRILRSNKSLILFPLFSGISTMLLIASFIIPVILSPEIKTFFLGAEPNVTKAEASGSVMAYVYAFSFYFLNYFIIAFFNTGLVFCALKAFKNEPAKFKDGFNEALKRLPQILGWSLIASSIGMVLRVIEERLSFVGRIIAAILGITFSVTSYLVIPVMVAENKSPIKAFNESASLLKKNWGKILKTNIGLGIITILLWLPALIIPAFVISASGSLGSVGLVIAVLSVILSLLYFLALILGESALSTIIKAALYSYGRDGVAPGGFDGDKLKAAISVK